MNSKTSSDRAFHRAQDFHGLRRYIRSDAVARQEGKSISLHSLMCVFVIVGVSAVTCRSES